jgi:hypothetical protein
MMQMVSDEKVLVVAVRDDFVSALRAMPVPLVVFTTRMGRRARGGVGAARVDRALVDMVPVLTMQMALVQIVDVVGVVDRRVPAACVVRVRMA